MLIVSRCGPGLLNSDPCEHISWTKFLCKEVVKAASQTDMEDAASP